MGPAAVGAASGFRGAARGHHASVLGTGKRTRAADLWVLVEDLVGASPDAWLGLGTPLSTSAARGFAVSLEGER